jgi:hypothetical protein
MYAPWDTTYKYLLRFHFAPIVSAGLDYSCVFSQNRYSFYLKPECLIHSGQLLAFRSKPDTIYENASNSFSFGHVPSRQSSPHVKLASIETRRYQILEWRFWSLVFSSPVAVGLLTSGVAYPTGSNKFRRDCLGGFVRACQNLGS